jgi:hypothetical protein
LSCRNYADAASRSICSATTGCHLLNRLADFPDVYEVGTAATTEYIDMRIKSRRLTMLGSQFGSCNRVVGA